MTNQEKSEARELWKSGKMNQSELARKYNVSRQYINFIFLGLPRIGKIVSEHKRLTRDENRIIRFRSRYVVSPNGCWIWIGYIDSNGYGIFVEGYAHRFSWKLNRGDILDGLLVLHKCNNRRCVNPDHLYLGTQADNMRDRMESEVYNTYGVYV